jgi:DNA-binding transcriptional LysR family regulator
MFPRTAGFVFHDLIMGFCQRAGFAPRVAQEAIQMQTVVSLVSSGLGVALVPASVANLGRRGVVYRELADAHPRLDLWLAWRRGTLGIAARDFVQLARRLI